VVNPVAVDEGSVIWGGGNGLAEPVTSLEIGVSPVLEAVTRTVADAPGATPVTVTGRIDPAARPTLTFPDPVEMIALWAIPRAKLLTLKVNPVAVEARLVILGVGTGFAELDISLNTGM
jgi:hypothetical protein